MVQSLAVAGSILYAQTDWVSGGLRLATLCHILLLVLHPVPLSYSCVTYSNYDSCGHILCGSCLHGAITARPGATQHLCPVCRTQIPDLRFKLPETRTNPDTPLNVLNGPDYIDVDQEEERWDPARSGVIGLEILTMGKL